MDVCVVLCCFVSYSEDKRQSQGNEVAEVQTEYREQKKFRRGGGFSAPVQTGPGTHADSYKMGTVSLFFSCPATSLNRPMGDPVG